jgi:diaminobutyrate-2-oxoglutarate transaminase
MSVTERFHPIDLPDRNTLSGSVPEASVFEDVESAVRSYCRRFPAVFATARGCHLYDTEGNAYTDFFSAAGSLNYGHNDPHLRDAMVDYLRRDGVVATLDMYTSAKSAFLRAFKELILQPRGLQYRIQFTGPTGTSVVESAIKLARKVTGRSNVIAFTNAFHGMSAGALSLTGSRGHRQSVMAGPVTRIPYDGYLGPDLNTMDLLRKLLGDASSGVDRPAAAIVETIQAEGGVRPASGEWLRQLSKLTAEHGILLIVDDIQTGCGRTGTFFSFEHSGIVPDLVCLSKSLSGVGLPFSVLLIRPEHDVWLPGEDNGTFRGNNLAFVSATHAVRRYWSDNRLALRVNALSALVTERLARLKEAVSPLIREVRGRGLMLGIELCDPALAQAVVTDCFRSRLIVEVCGPDDEVVKLLPPLTIDERSLLEGLAILEAAMHRAHTRLMAEPSGLATLAGSSACASERRETVEVSQDET